jgi:hypothetical protein
VCGEEVFKDFAGVTVTLQHNPHWIALLETLGLELWSAKNKLGAVVETTKPTQLI